MTDMVDHGDGAEVFQERHFSSRQGSPKFARRRTSCTPHKQNAGNAAGAEKGLLKSLGTVNESWRGR
jgi:hypothetical protein